MGAKVEHGPTDAVAVGEEKASYLAKFIARVGSGVLIVFLLVSMLSDGPVIRRRNPALRRARRSPPPRRAGRGAGCGSRRTTSG